MSGAIASRKRRERQARSPMAPAPQPCRRPQPGLCSATGAKRRIRRVTPRGEGCPASGQFPVSFDPTEGVFLLVRHDAAAGMSMTCTYDLKHNAYRRIEGTELPLLGSSAEAAIARRNFLLHDIRFVFWTIQTAANLRSFARQLGLQVTVSVNEVVPGVWITETRRPRPLPPRPRRPWAGRVLRAKEHLPSRGQPVFPALPHTAC